MQVAIAGILSGFAMLPFTDTFPYLFEKINTYQSYTVELREGLQEKYQEQKKARQAAAKELQTKMQVVYGKSRPGKTRVPAIPFDELPAIMRGEKTYEDVIRETEVARQGALRYRPERLSLTASPAVASPSLSVETDGLVVPGTEGVYQRSIPQRRRRSSVTSPLQSPLSPVPSPVRDVGVGSGLRLPPRIHLPSPTFGEGIASPVNHSRSRSRSRSRALSPTAAANMHPSVFAPRVEIVTTRPKRRTDDDDSENLYTPRPHRARTMQLPAYKLRGDWVNSDVLSPREDDSEDDDALMKLATFDRFSPSRQGGGRVTMTSLRHALNTRSSENGDVYTLVSFVCFHTVSLIH